MNQNTLDTKTINFTGLRDPIWQFIAIPIAIVGIISAIIFGLHFQQRKEISVKVGSSTVLKNDETSLGSRIKITFDSQEVDGISVNEIKFKNTGNTAITPVDYIEPITIESKDCNILASDVKDSSPVWLKDSLKIQRITQNKVKLSSILLNSNEDFLIRI